MAMAPGIMMQEVLRTPTYKKLTRVLVTTLFTRDELLTCSVTGKKGGGQNTPKRALDPFRVNFIIGKYYLNIYVSGS